MKVLGISGSARKDGNAVVIMGKIFEELSTAGIETELIQLSQQEIKPCKAALLVVEKEIVFTLRTVFARCSDSNVGNKKKPKENDEDTVQIIIHELRFPATTDAKPYKGNAKKRHYNEHISVVFSTYHSIETLSKAQKEYKLPDFDLVICDEAHSTTGVTFGNEEESHFVKVHNADLSKFENACI